jgi:cation diffusion facilitator family transporter
VILLATAGFEALVVVVSESVALLGDTLHNAADALTGVPLWLAFNLGKRPPTTRFTYRFGKAEDLASFVGVDVIAISPGLALYESVERLVHPETVTHLPVVMAAAIVGVISN